MQEQSSVGAPDKRGQYLSFRVGADDYAVDILRVQEIRGWETVRPLPDAPEYVKGVLDLRGTIVPIIDLRVRFGNRDPEYRSTTVVIILAVSHGDGLHLVGVVVDGVSDVLDAGQTEIKDRGIKFLRAALVPAVDSVVAEIADKTRCSQCGTDIAGNVLLIFNNQNPHQ